MALSSPSPVDQVTARSSASNSPHGSLLSYQEPQQVSSKSGLVSSQNGQHRSYGTVKQLSSSYKRSSISVHHHTVEEGETLQGVALKYNVTVHEIERLNNIWSTDSMFCKSSLKIPMSTDSSSHSNSPSHSPLHRQRNMSTPAGFPGSLPNGFSDLETENSAAEEVRSKLSVKRRAGSVTATCGEDGVKNIMDILNCADLQLQTSREFADKLAKRSSTLEVPKDAYHRTLPDTGSQSSSRSIPIPKKERSPKFRRRFRLKRANHTQDNGQAFREKLEDNLFEL